MRFTDQLGSGYDGVNAGQSALLGSIVGTDILLV